MKRLTFIALAAMVLAGCQDATQPADSSQPLFSHGPPDDPGRPDSPGKPQIVHDEGFESYAANSNIDGQGSWGPARIIGASGTGFFARDMEPIVGSLSGSLEFRLTSEIGNFGSHVSMVKSFENPIAGHRSLRIGRGSFVAVIPVTWNNPEVRKGFGRTQIIVCVVVCAFVIEHDAAGVLHVRTPFGIGGDEVPVGVPVLFEVVRNNADRSVEWFMNGALQVRGVLGSRGTASAESLIDLRGQVFVVAPGPTEPDQYDVLVDDIHLTLTY